MSQGSSVSYFHVYTSTYLVGSPRSGFSFCSTAGFLHDFERVPGQRVSEPRSKDWGACCEAKNSSVDVWTQAGAQDPKLIEGKGIGSQFQPEQSTLLSLAVQPKTADPGLETL